MSEPVRVNVLPDLRAALAEVEGYSEAELVALLSCDVPRPGRMLALKPRPDAVE